MDPVTLKLLIQLGVMGAEAFRRIKAMNAADPVAFDAALKEIGDDHLAALARLEAAAKP